MNQASSHLCTVFGIERPIFQAGMGYVTSGRIAGAVSAAGVSVGTRFMASFESDIHDNYRQIIVEADERSTTITRAWTGKPSRAWRSPFVVSWEGPESELQLYPEQAIDHSWRAYPGAVEGNIAEGFFPLGQCAAAIDSILPAAEIVDLLAAPAEAS